MNELEVGSIELKIKALKTVIEMVVSGEEIPGILRTVIEFVLPLLDDLVQDMLLILWAIIPKTSPGGKLLPEINLIADAYRRELEHAINNTNNITFISILQYVSKIEVF